MENETNSLLNSIMTEYRIKYLPLAWNEAKYHDGEVDLHFSVFDPYHFFDPALSRLRINGQNHSFNHHINHQLVDLTFSLKTSEINQPFAKIDFSFYPESKIPEDNWRQSWFVPLFVEKLNLPDAKRLLRVIGDTRTSSYTVAGADQAYKISLLIEKKLGLSLNQIKILDWGCGCGRISQFLPYLGASNLVGADIDQDNIQWCSESIKGAEFITLPYYPPTNFADETFDVVFGVSVMTHLTEETHKSWLQEVKRILKPGGYALLSIRGYVYYHLSKSWGFDVSSIVARIEQEGFIDFQRDGALDEVMAEQEYYRAAFCSHDYVRRVWSEYLHVIDTLEGLVLQDMIVLQKPRSN